MTKREARNMLQDLSDRIELFETIIENNSIPYESKKVLSIELNGLYAESMSIALKGLI